MFPLHVEKFLNEHRIEFPVIQAPMAGGPTSVELVLSVCKTGALGSFGAAYTSPNDLDVQINAIKKETRKPFSVNLFTYEPPKKPQWDESNPAISLYKQLYRQNNLNAPEGFIEPKIYLDEQVDIVVKNEVPIVSFTLGVPSNETISRIQSYGGKVWVTITSLQEARIAADSGVDCLIAQGIEAGGHRASFSHNPEEAPQTGLITLVQLVCNEIDLPVIASGGLMSGGAIYSTMVLGAVAGQLGTAFLACHETPIPISWKDSLFKASDTDTILTSSFSGRLARGIKNKHTETFKDLETSIPAFPYVNSLTKSLRQKSKQDENVDHQSLWAGQGCSLARKVSAKELVEELVSEISNARSL